jgi:hypothetical protein
LWRYKVRVGIIAFQTLPFGQKQYKRDKLVDCLLDAQLGILVVILILNVLCLWLILLSEQLFDLGTSLASFEIIHHRSLFQGEALGFSIEKQSQADVESERDQKDSIVSPLDFLIRSVENLLEPGEQHTSRAIGVTN